MKSFLLRLILLFSILVVINKVNCCDHGHGHGHGHGLVKILFALNLALK